MLFPSFHIPLLGDGMTIALVAVTHVLISHGLAIGMLTLIVVLQHIGLRNNDHEIWALAQRMLKPVVIIVTAVGAVTGAGIWFTVSVLAPNGIGSLLRVFFWPWFFEWIAFSLEVFILLPYYFLWDRMNATHPKRHLALGWSYVFVAFVSAFLISGILGFMLTPDGWVQEHALWTAFFNPTFWPQLFLRVLGGLTLGGLLSTGYILYSFRLDLELRRWTARFFGGWIIVCGSLAAVAAWFYFDAIPSTYATHKVFAVMTSHFSQQPQWLLLANLLAAAFVFGLALVAYFRRLRLAHVLIIPALLSAFLFVVQFERIREFIRGPYLIPGYMYANQISLTLS